MTVGYERDGYGLLDPDRYPGEKPEQCPDEAYEDYREYINEG